MKLQWAELCDKGVSGSQATSRRSGRARRRVRPGVDDLEGRVRPGVKGEGKRAERPRSEDGPGGAMGTFCEVDKRWRMLSFAVFCIWGS